jgi:Uncharacterized Fe-S protein
MPSILHSTFKQAAKELGFCACGIAPAAPVESLYAEAFRQWIGQSHHAGMQYMANYEDKRLDPRLLLPGAQSILVVALNYYPEKRLEPSQLQFAYYAYGKDYHDVMRDRLRQLAGIIFPYKKSVISSAEGETEDPLFKLCCDTVPFLDRYWAKRAGLGWIGKNTNLIIPKVGSYCFIGAIITTLPADRYDSPMPEHCGTCEQCLKACPTKALCAPHSLDARRCLSYLTIENREEIPSQYHSALGSSQLHSSGASIYGCDRCQQACPHNRFAQPTQVSEFSPSDEFLAMQPDDWQHLTPETYRQLFRGSAVKRAKYEGLMRNIQAANSRQ